MFWLYICLGEKSLQNLGLNFDLKQQQSYFLIVSVGQEFQELSAG